MCIQSNPNPPSEQPSAPKHIPEHHVREAVNPRTGRRERVFVDLEAVYPDCRNPAHEVSFEELRAIKRGWMDKKWRHKEPLQQISGNAAGDAPPAKLKVFKDGQLPNQHEPKLATDERLSQSQHQDGPHEGKAGKARKFKVQGETQTSQCISIICKFCLCKTNAFFTVKMKFDSPTSSKARRKSTREPTMTMHTRAATDEIYGIFNQPLKAEMDDAADSLYGSEYEDEDCASTVDSTGTGHISAASSDFGDDETHTFHKSYDDTEYGDGNTTRADSVVGGDWTDFSVSKDVPGAESADATSHSAVSQGEVESEQGTPEKERFIPRMPDDYNPPYGTYRDPAIMAQNRLPFMTPIVERTESSISMTAARSLHNAKTPSKPRSPSVVPQMGDLLASPYGTTTPYHGDHTVGSVVDVPFSPTAFKALAPKSRRREAIIKDLKCNPTDKGIRNTILNSLEPPLASYPGYHSHVQDSNYATMIQKFVKAHSRKSRGADDERSETPILEFPGAERSYIIRRELGAGAYAPVYLAESVNSQESYGPDSDEEFAGKRINSNPYDSARHPFEAVKVENGPSSAWEFYMIRTAHERLRNAPQHTRATDSVVRAHELHVHQRESFLVEDYRGQGTLLDLVNILRTDAISSAHPSDGGIDEVLAMFFSIELFRTVEALHATGILHGDIKADNCLVRLDESLPTDPPTKALSLLDLGDSSTPATDPRDGPAYAPSGRFGWRAKGLALIDFGRAIDMNAFVGGVQFLADWETGTHECNEIREARPWTHQIDLYGIAGVVHVLLFGKYIESAPVHTSEGGAGLRTYRIRESLKRYWEREIWSDVFDLLLNPGAGRWVAMEGGAGNGAGAGPILPVLKSMAFVRERMEEWLAGNAEKKGLALQLRRIEAVLAERKKKLERI